LQTVTVLIKITKKILFNINLFGITIEI